MRCRMRLHTCPHVFFFFNPIWPGQSPDMFGTWRDTVSEKKRRRKRWKPEPLSALTPIDLLPPLLLLLLLTLISSLVFFFSSDLLHLLLFTWSPPSSSSFDLFFFFFFFFFFLRPNLFLLWIFLLPFSPDLFVGVSCVHVYLYFAFIFSTNHVLLFKLVLYELRPYQVK